MHGKSEQARPPIGQRTTPILNTTLYVVRCVSSSFSSSDLWDSVSTDKFKPESIDNDGAGSLTPKGGDGHVFELELPSQQVS